MALSRRSYRSVALFLAYSAGSTSAQQPVGAALRLARDPDRGLDAAFRERLALVDPARGSSPCEAWAALVDARLRVVTALWSEDRLEAGLASEKWIAADLRVAPLFGSVPAHVHNEWSLLLRTRLEAPEPAERTFGRALAEWRAVFTGEARLACDVFAIAGEAQRFETRVRVVACGPSGAARVQHDAVWSCTWRVADSGAELIAVRPESFEAAGLAHHPDGLFADVTCSFFEDASLFRTEVAPGLDEWRRSIAAQIEPGFLGHHGLAVGDVNGDGLEDLYWCRPGGLPNKLLLHTTADQVADASAASGVDFLDYTSSALLGDFDGEGDLDLVLSTGNGLAFFANDGRARFTPALRVERSLATSLAAADYDGDGDLDVYACSYVSPYERNGTPIPYHDANNGEANTLLRNDGEWKLVDATAAVGMDANNQRFSLAASWEDYDEDGDQDLYVANDFGANNLYRNDGGRFVDVAAELGALDVAAGMGVTWGDVDEDGWMDLYVTNMDSLAGRRLTAQAEFRLGSSAPVTQAYHHHAQGNTLLLNQKGAGFRDVTVASGAGLGRWGWGGLFVDFDNDGTLDLFAPNGFVTGERREDLDSFFWREVVLRSPDTADAPADDYRLSWRAARYLVRAGYSWNGNERNVAFLGLGAARFADVSSATALDQLDDARAAARVDWDGDGDEDLIVTNRTAPMLRVLLDQQSSANKWVAFVLEGNERTAVGARVQLETVGGRRLVRTLRCGEGYLAQSTARVHFGLGTDEVARVGVRWPGGATEEFGRPAAGALHVLRRGTGTARALERTHDTRLVARPPEIPAPGASARTVLPTPLPLPRLAVETMDGHSTSLLGITMQGPRGIGQPLLLVLWSSSGAPCRNALERLGSAAEELRVAGVQVLALCVDAGEERGRARTELAALEWSSAGFASEEALLVLEQVDGALHDDERPLVLPAAFLVDPEGQLLVTYTGELDPARIEQDLSLLTLSAEERRSACVPLSGRWLASPPGSFEQTVAARLDARGLERSAGEYRLARVEVRQLGSPSQFDLAVVSHRAGRLAEAAGHYRAALERDPGHVRAAQNLAVVLHKLGDYPSALEAYAQALKLDPGDASTRCNLGFLYLTLRDRDGATKQLEALRSLESDLAPTLESRIREMEQQ